MNAWQRLRYRLLTILDQVFMIFNLPTLSDDRSGRMRRLRRIYYHNPAATMSHGRVRDIVHGHVGHRYRRFYEQLLTVERAIYDGCMRLPAGIDHEQILFQAQRLGDALAALIDDLERSEMQLKTIRQNSTVAAEAIEIQRDAIKQQLDAGFEQQAQIPLRLQSLISAKAGQQMGRLSQEIERLTLFTEDVAASYQEMHEQQLQNTIEREINED